MKKSLAACAFIAALAMPSAQLFAQQSDTMQDSKKDTMSKSDTMSGDHMDHKMSHGKKSKKKKSSDTMSSTMH